MNRFERLRNEGLVYGLGWLTIRALQYGGLLARQFEKGFRHGSAHWWGNE